MIALARITQVLAAETARRVHAADARDVTATGTRATLAAQGWSGRAAWVSLHAGGFTDRHPALAGWRAGTINEATITTIALGVRGLPAADADAVVAWLTPLLPRLDDRQVKIAVTAAVDQLRPQDSDERERQASNERSLTSTRFRDQVIIEAKLPALEAEAFLATVDAYAEKLRTDNDGLSKAQRAADALAAMVAALAADGKTPTHNGQPAAATVLLPLSEAERIIDGIPRQRQPLPDCTDLPGVGRDDGRPFDTLRDRQRCSHRPFTGLPLATGVIGTHHTLSDAAARFLLCTAELTGVIVTTGHDPHPTPSRMLAALLGAAPLQPLDLGRGQRFATTAQRHALEVRDRGCVIEGCSIQARHCQTHHHPGWAEGGTTDTNHLALLCWPHHRQVDEGRWILKRNPDSNGNHWLAQPQPRHRWRQ